jgi:hypothetical protein
MRGTACERKGIELKTFGARSRTDSLSACLSVVRGTASTADSESDQSVLTPLAYTCRCYITSHHITSQSSIASTTSSAPLTNSTSHPIKGPVLPCPGLSCQGPYLHPSKLLLTRCPPSMPSSHLREVYECDLSLLVHH